MGKFLTVSRITWGGHGNIIHLSENVLVWNATFYERQQLECLTDYVIVADARFCSEYLTGLYEIFS